MRFYVKSSDIVAKLRQNESLEQLKQSKLYQDILANGILEPVTVCNGLLQDGNRRIKIAQMLYLEFVEVKIKV